MDVESAEPSCRADPTRPVRRDELNLPVNLRQVEQTESRGIEFEETASPSGAQVEIGGVEANSRLVVIADANGQRLGDRAVGHLERGCEKLADIGAAPAIVDPILFILRVRFAPGDGWRAGRPGFGRGRCPQRAVVDNCRWRRRAGDSAPYL